jgi:CheY-like chemotaxis protein
MTEPLALVLYERLLPGSQVVNRLQDLRYRVQTVAEARLLVECAEQAGPLLVLVDLEPAGKDVCAQIARLKQNPRTRHLPVIAFSSENAADLQAAAQAAGATLVATDTAILNHLPQLLEQALQLE